MPKSKKMPTRAQIIKKLTTTVETLNNEILSLEDLFIHSRSCLKDYEVDFQLYVSFLQVRNYLRDNLNDWLE